MNNFTDLIRDFISAQRTWAAVILVLILSFDGILFLLSPKLPRGSPPPVPYTLPWLGHAIAFAKDNNGFIERVKKQFPKDGITTLLLGGKTLYLVTDTTLASHIYRSSKSFAFDPLALLVSVVFGCNENDMKILEKGANDYTVKSSPSAAQEKEPLLKKLHHMSSTQLQGESVDRMTAEFVKNLKANIEVEFPETNDEGWKELELAEFVKRQFTLASIASLFGTQLLEREGAKSVYAWFWKGLDPHVATLFTKLPDWIVRRAARSRDFGLDMLVRWERAAKRAETSGLIKENDEGVAWNEYWGLSFMKERAKLVGDYGISERGRAGLQLALLWGQNANAIPCAVWLFIQALSPSSPPDLLTKLHHEIQTSTTTSGSLNFSSLNAQPHVYSLLLEVLRWTTSSPGVRVVQSDTQVGPYLLKQGGLVMVHARTLQLNPEVWGPDAETFDAARFLSPTSSPDKEQEKLRKLSQRAFGGGQNLCPGRHFATNEILGGFAAIMGMLNIEVLNEEWEVPRVRVDDGKQGGLWPDRGVRVRVRRRREGP